MSEINAIEDPKWDVGDALCNLFEGGKVPFKWSPHELNLTTTAASQAKRSRNSKEDHSFSLTELDWFSKNSYNLALRSSAEREPRQTLRLLRVSIEVLLHPRCAEISWLQKASITDKSS